MNQLKTHHLIALADHAYCNGQTAMAAKMYERAANIADSLSFVIPIRRRHGHTLMWNARHEEALRILLPIASCDRSDIQPDTIIAARADVIMIALHHAPLADCLGRLAEAEAYCDGVGRPGMRQRTHLLRAFLDWTRGRHDQALQHALLGKRLSEQHTCTPCYSAFAHEKWIVRPLFSLRRHEELRSHADHMIRMPKGMVSDELRARCARLLDLRLSLALSGDPVLREQLRDAAHAAARAYMPRDPGFEEIFEIALAFLLAGEPKAIAQFSEPPANLFHFHRAALAADSHINRLRQRIGLLPWDPDLDWPPTADATRGAAADITNKERTALDGALSSLDRIATSEDTRLETDVFSRAAHARRRHAATLIGESSPAPEPCPS